MFKKILAAFLVLCFTMSTLTPAFAADTPDISPEALRVSDEFAARYPNGLLEFATVNFETSEDAEDFTVYVVRRGGTAGEVSVNIKVIETSAKYGDDFTVLVPEWYGDKTLKKEVESPTMLESAVEEGKYSVIAPEDTQTKDDVQTQDNTQDKDAEVGAQTGDNAESNANTQAGEDSQAADSTQTKADTQTQDGAQTGDDAPADANAQTGDNEQTAGSVQANDAQAQDNMQNTDNEQGKDIGKPAYASSLHQLRDEALGVKSKAPEAVGTPNQVFDVEDPQQAEASATLNSVMPGAVAALTFADGENYKTFKIHICDDDKAESPEQFNLGLCDVTGGAALGDAVGAGCNINDNDKGSGSVIGFAQDTYSVYPSDGQAELILVRTGDTDTYADFEISTLSGSAKADRDYDPVMCDAMFLPGETEKAVKIPLLTQSVTEELSFDVVVTRDGKETGGVSRAAVNILPGEKVAELMTAAAAQSAYTSPREIVYYGDEFALDYAENIDLLGRTYTRFNPILDFPPRGWDIEVGQLTGGDTGGRSSVHKYLDLRGIGTVTVDWRQRYVHSSTASKIYMNGIQYCYMNGFKFDGITPFTSKDNFPREKTVVMTITGEAGPRANSRLGVRSVTLRKQEFPVVVESAAPLTYTKWEGRTNVGTSYYDPGTIFPSSSVACLDDTITFAPSRSVEGEKRNSYYRGFEVKGPYGWVPFYDPSGGSVTLTPDFITTYIYQNGSPKWNEKLIVRPVYTTWPVTVAVLPGDKSQGDLYWGDYLAGSSPELQNEDWVRQGDEIVLGLAPKTGYSGKGFDVKEYKTLQDFTDSRSINSEVDLPVDKVIAKESFTYIRPIFTRNDKSVSIEWKRYEVGKTEPRELNVTRGMVLHDHTDYMPGAEKAVLYNGAPSAPSYPNAADYTKEGVMDSAAYEEAKAAYRRQADARYQKIMENYPAYRDQFSTRTLEHLPIGEMVTLYAQPQEGYTVIWEVEDTTSTVGTGDLVKYIAHMGPSFTFEVTNSLQKVYYYFIEVNDAGSNILSGKVIQEKNTLRSEHFTRVDLNNPDSYIGVPNATVSVGVADPSLSSVTVNGKTYSTTATTDKDGNFQIYVPFGVPNQLYSVKVIDGDEIYAQSVLVGKNIMIELPFMNNFKVWNFSIKEPPDSKDPTHIPQNYGAQVPLEDKTADISFVTTSSDGRTPSKIKLRSYTSGGALWQTIEADTTNGRTWTINGLNLKENFKDDGRLTVEMYDDRGIGYGEIESGFNFFIKPAAQEVSLPSLGGTGGTDIDILGNVNPGADLGSTYSLEPNVNGKTYTIAVNVGETIKTIIAQNVNKFDNKTPIEKVAALTAYLPDVYTTSKQTEIKWKNSAAAKTGISQTPIDLEFDIGFYIQITKKNNGSNTDFLFEYAIIYAAAKVSMQQDFTASIYGIPVYMRLRGDANVRTLVLAQGDDTTKLDLANGWFPKDLDLRGSKFGGVVAFGLTAAIGAGIGTRKVLSAGLEGEATLKVVYEPWTEGRGTVTLALNADIDVLVIPLHFTLTEKTFPLFQTEHYVPVDWISNMEPQDATTQALRSLSQSDVKAGKGTFSRANGMSAWNGAANALMAAGGEITQTTLQSGIYKHPEPQLLSLGEGKKILFFLNDDISRGDYDRSALYYSVCDGGVWSPPVLVQNDGTVDYEPYAKVVGDKVLVTWSSAAETFGNEEPSMPALLNSGDIYAQFFTLDGTPDGDVERLTFGDGQAYGDDTPRIAYDEETGNIMLLYHKTDYSTEGVEYHQPSDIGSFVNNSYSAVAYRMYVDGQWQTSYYPEETSYLEYENEHGAGSLHGERFIDFDLAGVDPVKISEISFGSYDGEAQIIYTYDIDNDPNTKEDTEIFMKVYSFEQRIFTPPVRLTDDLTQDANPQQVEYGGKDYLFWNHDGYITYLDIYGLLNYDLTRHDEDGGYYYELKDGYKSFLTVSKEQNYTAGESYTVTLGDNGGLYVVWNAPAGDKESSDAKGLQLFAAAYDPNFYKTGPDENGNPTYAGGWGVPQQLTDTIGQYNSEQSVCADEDGVITIISRTYERVPDESTPENDSWEADLSSLVERTVTPASRLEVDTADITVYPEYPKAGEPVTLTAKAKNTGLMPVNGATFRFERSDGADGWTPLGEDVALNYNIPSGEDIAAQASFVMPENFSADSPARLRISAWTGDGAGNASQTLYTLSPAQKLEFSKLEGRFVDKDTVRIMGLLKNTGNADAENLTLNIASNDDARKGDTDEKPFSLATLEVGTIPTAGNYSIDKTVDVDASGIEPGADMEFILKTSPVSGSEETCTGFVMATTKNLNTGVSDILVNDGKPLSMRVGTAVNLGATVLPYTAANTHRLRYTSLTPDIAEVDLSSGMVTAKRAGTAQILVEAENVSGSTYLMSADGHLYDAAGNTVEFDDTGAVVNPGEDAGSGDIALSKTVSVTVTKPSGGSSSSSSSGSVSGVTKMSTGADGITLTVKANATLTRTDISAALNKLAAEGIEKKNIRIVSEGDAVILEKNALNAFVENMLSAEVSLPAGTIVLSDEALKEMASQAVSNVSIRITGTSGDDGKPVIDATIQSGSKNITDFNGKRITLLMPYTLKTDEDENAVVVYCVGEDGQRSMMANSVYEDGKVAFRTNHLSKFAGGYNKISFGDVTGWAEAYVSYLAARDVVNGVGDGKFMPENPVTRAEFVKMLALLSGDEIQPVTDSRFKDVDKNSWYAPYVSWASENGYVLGVSDTAFAPGDKITREQIAVIVQRFADKEVYGLASKNEGKVFADSADISDYARDAVAFLSTTGIISGKDNNLFAPKNNATRAESAKMLALLLHTGLEAENAFWGSIQ